MSDQPTDSAQDNTARDGGVQYITGGGDINVYPPPRGGGRRFAKRRVVLTAAAGVAVAAATVITVALLPSSPAGSTRAAPGAPARPAPSVSSAAPSVSASASGRSSSAPPTAPERPKADDDAPAHPPPSTEEKRPPEPRTDGAERAAAIRHASPTDHYPAGTVCAARDEWTPVPGMTGVAFQPCVYAQNKSGKALFGVTVRNTTDRQVAVAAWVGYRMSEQEYECSPPFRQDGVVIDPHGAWSSQLTQCIRTIEGAHRVAARAGVSDDGANPTAWRAYSGGVDIAADGRAAPVRYPG